MAQGNNLESRYIMGLMLRFVSCLCLLFLAACSGGEIASDGGDLTRGEVEFLSRRMSEAIEKEYPLLNHKMVNRYMDSLGQAIVSRNPGMPPLPYEFRVLKSNEVFVFSLPGGIVYVTLGTLRAVELEGQLAAALAHELAHQQLNHALIEWRRKVNANRGQRYVLDFSGDWRTRFLGEKGALHLDKGMEEEADRLAPVILYRAQFDPRVYVSYLQMLKKMEQSEMARVRNLVNLHPPVVERQAWVKEALVKLPPMRDPRVNSSTFQELKIRLKEAESKAKQEKKNGKR